MPKRASVFDGTGPGGGSENVEDDTSSISLTSAAALCASVRSTRDVKLSEDKNTFASLKTQRSLWNNAVVHLWAGHFQNQDNAKILSFPLLINMIHHFENRKETSSKKLLWLEKMSHDHDCATFLAE